MIGWVLFLIMSVLERFPKIWNAGMEVTEGKFTSPFPAALFDNDIWNNDIFLSITHKSEIKNGRKREKREMDIKKQYH